MVRSKKIFPSKLTFDEKWMQRALSLAKKGASLGEVPIAALIIKDNKLLSSAYNRRESLHDATAHAEILAIRKACKKIGDWRLDNTTLYVTMEPCLMCFGAIHQARIGKVIYACKNSKNPKILREIYQRYPKGPKILGGILEAHSIANLKHFFSHLRK